MNASCYGEILAFQKMSSWHVFMSKQEKWDPSIGSQVQIWFMGSSHYHRKTNIVWILFITMKDSINIDASVYKMSECVFFALIYSLALKN